MFQSDWKPALVFPMDQPEQNDGRARFGWKTKNLFLVVFRPRITDRESGHIWSKHWNALIIRRSRWQLKNEWSISETAVTGHCGLWQVELIQHPHCGEPGLKSTVRYFRHTHTHIDQPSSNSCGFTGDWLPLKPNTGAQGFLLKKCKWRWKHTWVLMGWEIMERPSCINQWPLQTASLHCWSPDFTITSSDKNHQTHKFKTKTMQWFWQYFFHTEKLRRDSLILSLTQPPSAPTATYCAELMQQSELVGQ